MRVGQARSDKEKRRQEDRTEKEKTKKAGADKRDRNQTFLHLRLSGQN